MPLSPIGLLLEEETHLVARKPKAQPSTRQQNMVSFKHARCCSCEARGRTACSAGRSSENLDWSIGPSNTANIFAGTDSATSKRQGN